MRRGSRSSNPRVSDAPLAGARWAALSLSLTAIFYAPGAHCEDDKATCIANHEQAQIAQREGKLNEARVALLSCTSASCPAIVRADCAAWLSELAVLMPSVVLSAQVDDEDAEAVRVSMDGQLLTTKLDGQAIEIDPGLHVFRFELPPYAPVERKVMIREGEKSRIVSATFAAPEKAAPPPTTKPAPLPPKLPQIEVRGPVPLAAYLLGGTAIAGAGLFAGFAASGMASRSSLLARCAPLCDDAEVQGVKTKFLVADISLVTAASAAVALGAVLLMRPKLLQRGAAPPTASIWIAPGPRGALSGGVF